MKKRIFPILILVLTIALTTFSLRLIYWDSSYFRKSLYIENASSISSLILPFLIILSFYKKLTKFLAVLNIFILILCFCYGFYFVSDQQMLSVHYYLNLTIGWTVAIILLSVVIYKDKKTITVDT
jgi:hypothetical protein